MNESQLSAVPDDRGGSAATSAKCIPDGVRFLLDGQRVCSGALEAETTLLDFLRESLGRTGTKEGCAEGDCGACTVLVGEPGTDRVQYRAVNSCIRLLGSVDGCEVVTVESLQDPKGGLHPVQQALVDTHGSQCGFCTPGMVMSLLALYLGRERPTRPEIIDALAGNLCRCTGYRPIVDAGLRMDDYPAPRCWSRDSAADPGRLEALRALAPESGEDTRELLPGFQAPTTLDALAALREQLPQARLLAGGTDLGLRVTKGLERLTPLIFTGRVPELRHVRADDEAFEIGAAVSLTDAFRALVGDYPELTELFNRFASPPVRNAGTLAGNIANGSPIGDSMPALIALGARLQLHGRLGTRSIALEDFPTGYRRNVLAPGEFIAAVRVPRRAAAGSGLRLAAYKLARRFDQDISAISAGLAFHLEDGLIVQARLAFGGMAATPARAPRTEAALQGQPWTAEAFESAGKALAQDFTPIDDHRASAAYRLAAARALLMRCQEEHAGRPDTRLATGTLGLGTD